MKYLYAILALGLSWNSSAQNSYVTGNHWICQGDELTLFAGGDSSYTWLLLSDLNTILSTTNWVNVYPEIGDTVVLYTFNDTIYTPVNFDPYQCDYHCYVPNIFTPDGDLFNEQFCPILYGKETLGTRLTICNRAGKVVFDDTALYPPCWDGRYDKTGMLVEDGLYVWFFSYIREDNTTEHLNGFVVLGK